MQFQLKNFCVLRKYIKQKEQSVKFSQGRKNDKNKFKTRK